MANSRVVSGTRRSGVGEDELADDRVEGEAGDAVADRQHQHRGRAVDRVAGGDLLACRAAGTRQRWRPSPGRGARSTEKIEPTATLTSMLDEPSSGSKTSRYLPRGCWPAAGSAPRSSSETMPARCRPTARRRRKISLASTSSFFCSSPCTLATPGLPSTSASAPWATARADRLAGLGDLQDEGVELAGGLGVAAPLLDQVLGQRGAVDGAWRSPSVPVVVCVMECGGVCVAAWAVGPTPRPAGSRGWRGRRPR